MKRGFVWFICIVLVFAVKITSVNAVTVKYYKQLNKEQKKIYKEMYKHFYVNDEQEYTIDIHEIHEGIAMETVGSRKSRNALLAYSALINDHPEFYWANQISVS